MDSNGDIHIGDPNSHCMGKSLIKYIDQRVHPGLTAEALREIRVVGSALRGPPAQIALFEHKRQFDFRRPTASTVGPYTIQLNCFPSKALVIHYASIVATYLSLRGKPEIEVRTILPKPGEMVASITRSNIQHLGQADIAIIGDVDQLQELMGSSWEGGGTADPKFNIFQWQKRQSPKGKTIATIGCFEKIWGKRGTI
jgi:hypothetical protein